MNQEKQKKLVLVDGSSYLFRAYHGLPQLTSPSGHPTGAIYGVLNMLRKLLKDEQPDRVAVVFDAKGKTFRNDIYPEYKANRPPMPDDLRVQIEPLHQIIEAQGLPLIVVPGVEADDVIGTMSQQASEQGYQVLISTGDKDMAQLVNANVSLINTMNNHFMDEASVVEKFQVKADQIIDYLALMGDSSDNIPGVPKVGPKTAAKWIGEFGSLQGVMENAADFKGKIGEYLRESLEFLPMSYELATIKLDCDTGVSIDQLEQRQGDPAALAAFYREFGFTRWYDETDSVDAAGEQPLAPQVDADYECVLDQTSFDRWLKRLRQADSFAVDTETTSIDYMQAELVGISLCLEAGKACYIPLTHSYEGAPEQLDKSGVLAALKPVLEDPEIGKIGQNIKYDAHIFIAEGIRLRGIAHDTMLESYVLNSTASRHNMDALAKYYLDRDTIHYQDIAGKGVKQKTFDQIELEQASDYAAEDADITLQLHQVLGAGLRQDEKLHRVYRDIEMPLVDVLLDVEQNGVLIDPDMLEKQGREVDRQLQQVEQAIYQLAGEVFNLSSPKQIQEILFEKLELPVLRKTPKGQPSTAEDVLEELAADYEIPALILEHRSLNKLMSTYIDKLPQEINARTGRVHTSYQQAVASTGRLSSTSPNLQNIPVRTAEGRRIREAFVAPAGCKILALDYSQIELRIMAHLSADESLLNAFAQGLDVHRATAAEVFGANLDQVNADQRRAAKAINFGLIYGMSAFGLGKQLNIGRNEAQQYVDTYFERYPGVKRYMEETKQRARDQGYVETVFGRRLYLPDIKARNANVRQYAERTAINAPMQGTAADIIKRAMITVQGWIAENSDACKMIMQVHDELVFEVAESEIERSRDRIAELMTGAAELSVGLEVDAGVGQNWNQAH
ncbi:MAG: DNA polymerase I (EC 2.7.7.7) [Olavius algarvensis Gamma 3 endosymbiont]|nr:MAG: DNA polymerase I (EC 2.7.7.7) [Olavius algarvensis Gamma 3 endosymbiont]